MAKSKEAPSGIMGRKSRHIHDKLRKSKQRHIKDIVCDRGSIIESRMTGGTGGRNLRLNLSTVGQLVPDCGDTGQVQLNGYMRGSLEVSKPVVHENHMDATQLELKDIS